MPTILTQQELREVVNKNVASLDEPLFLFASYAIPTIDWVFGPFAEDWIGFLKKKEWYGKFENGARNCVQFARLCAAYAAMCHVATEGHPEGTALAMGEMSYERSPPNVLTPPEYHMVNPFIFRNGKGLAMCFFEPQNGLQAFLTEDQKYNTSYARF